MDSEEPTPPPPPPPGRRDKTRGTSSRRRSTRSDPAAPADAAGRALTRDELVALVREIRDAEVVEAARLAEQEALDAARVHGSPDDDPDGLEERTPFFLRFDDDSPEEEEGADPDP